MRAASGRRRPAYVIAGGLGLLLLSWLLFRFVYGPLNLIPPPIATSDSLLGLSPEEVYSRFGEPVYDSRGGDPGFGLDHYGPGDYLFEYEYLRLKLPRPAIRILVFKDEVVSRDLVVPYPFEYQPESR